MSCLASSHLELAMISFCYNHNQLPCSILVQCNARNHVSDDPENVHHRLNILWSESILMDLG